MHMSNENKQNLLFVYNCKIIDNLSDFLYMVMTYAYYKRIKYLWEIIIYWSSLPYSFREAL